MHSVSCGLLAKLYDEKFLVPADNLLFRYQTAQSEQVKYIVIVDIEKCRARRLS